MKTEPKMTIKSLLQLAHVVVARKLMRVTRLLHVERQENADLTSSLEAYKAENTDLYKWRERQGTLMGEMGDRMRRMVTLEDLEHLAESFGANAVSYTATGRHVERRERKQCFDAASLVWQDARDMVRGMLIKPIRDRFPEMESTKMTPHAECGQPVVMPEAEAAMNERANKAQRDEAEYQMVKRHAEACGMSPVPTPEAEAKMKEMENASMRDGRYVPVMMSQAVDAILGNWRRVCATQSRDSALRCILAYKGHLASRGVDPNFAGKILLDMLDCPKSA